MAVHQYIAIAKGYVDGRVINEGEAFAHEFVEIVRDTSARKGPGDIYPVKRDKDGKAVTKPADHPSWAEPVDAVAYAAARALDTTPGDVSFEAMSVSELRAYAATLPVDVAGLKSKDDIITVIKAWDDPTR